MCVYIYTLQQNVSVQKSELSSRNQVNKEQNDNSIESANKEAIRSSTQVKIYYKKSDDKQLQTSRKRNKYNHQQKRKAYQRNR